MKKINNNYLEICIASKTGMLVIPTSNLLCLSGINVTKQNMIQIYSVSKSSKTYNVSFTRFEKGLKPNIRYSHSFDIINDLHLDTFREPYKNEFIKFNQPKIWDTQW